MQPDADCLGKALRHARINVIRAFNHRDPEFVPQPIDGSHNQAGLARADRAFDLQRQVAPAVRDSIAGVFGRDVVSADAEEGVEDLANLPTRDQLYANVLGSLQGPAASLVGVLNGALSELLRTLQAKAEQGGGEPAPAG